MVASAPCRLPTRSVALADARRGAPPTPRRRRRARTKRRTGRRLFQFDRGLGVRWIAGADEAGRGCLAGPLVAAAVLFDVEAPRRPRGPRADARSTTPSSTTPEAREELYPVVMRTAAKVVGRLALRARHRRLRAAQDQPRRAARRARAASRGPGCLCLVDGFAVPDFGHEQRAIVDGDAHERRDRRRLDRRQGHARPLHAPRRRAAPGLGVPLATSATRRPSTATRSSARASRRCTGSRSRARRTSSSPSRRGRHQNAASRWSRRTSLPLRVDDDADRVEAQVGGVRAVGDLEQEGRGHPPDLAALALVQRLPRSAPGARWRAAS